ncbi:MAG: hypothetical protein ACYTG0_37235 [Planctomycetota bacterium]|jgi:hypothetical protein
MGQWYRVVMQYIENMDIQEWLVAFFGVVVVGLFCLRGFGSRSDY